MEPSDKTSISSSANCSSMLNGGEGVHNMAECSVGVNSKIDDKSVEDFVYNGGIYDELEGEDLSASPSIKTIQNTVPVSDAKTLGNDRHMSAKMATEVRDSRRSSCEDEITVGKTLAGSEDEIEISFSDAAPGSSFPVDTEALKKQCPSEEIAAATDSESLTDAVVVCERKPRKKKQKEMIAGKPQFHPPPKAIFKPAVQVKIQTFEDFNFSVEIKVWCTVICMIHFHNLVKVFSQAVETKRFRNSNEGNLDLSAIS